MKRKIYAFAETEIWSDGSYTLSTYHCPYVRLSVCLYVWSFSRRGSVITAFVNGYLRYEQISSPSVVIFVSPAANRCSVDGVLGQFVL